MLRRNYVEQRGAGSFLDVIQYLTTRTPQGNIRVRESIDEREVNLRQKKIAGAF